MTSTSLLHLIYIRSTVLQSDIFPENQRASCVKCFFFKRGKSVYLIQTFKSFPTYESIIKKGNSTQQRAEHTVGGCTCCHNISQYITAFPVLFTPNLRMKLCHCCDNFLYWNTSHTSALNHNVNNNNTRLMCSYIGTRLHRVSQIAAEVAGLVLSFIAAGQLAQALRNKRNERFQYSLRKYKMVSEWHVACWMLWVFTVSCISCHLIIAGDSAVVSLRGQHHVQLSLICPSLSLIAGVESQG